MELHKKNTFNEIKEKIEFKVCQLESEKNHEDVPTENTVHEWPGHPYASASYSGHEPLEIRVAVNYEKDSKTFGLSYRKEINEYYEGHAMESVHKLKDYQGLSIDDAIKIGNELNERLVLELFDLPKNTLEQTEVALDKNTKNHDAEIEL